MFANMAVTLWNLMEAAILCVNAVCILHEQRFLAKFGWGADQPLQGYEVKSKVLKLVHSIRTVMRIPLILLNIIMIFMKLILG